MNTSETRWDKLLKIKTSGRDDSRSDQYRYPYEPTPYSVLERLANSGYIRKKNVLLDYGCGKGRVELFMTYQTRCHAIGIEYDDRIFATACENKKSGISGERTTFLLENAENYQVPIEVDRVFFFNPFSIEILRKVIAAVTASCYENPRELLLFFYYPQNEYISYLMTVDELMFVDEIDCRDLFDGENSRERIVIFEVSI
ncbi:class I SAM-dependent methyltransferase [Blautia glucerasea]|uniref:class I SAM-dependent methyltransferase n=1 Tax=Blautia TaxID=572511 RepID=UPI001D02E00B|nr:class I SAM-dependent methyltransferase [Blautia glucerasea]MCB5386976.1 class I SAM-dependent methyltransferase [Blautia glucerasea]MCB5421558.1 class I SAM-dependent methyltransferase [Blautia luti]